ncbi:hypothetical protein Drose_06115 [Dactylosporangium roseum]|uniref:Minor tail protein n=1 Tax=Dactylosporangium roseum TaxID=47989 RepID=A0ABY5Z7M2_9ACTN|nr:hypothetical protein [Dactylosporangium roseum]UWZ37847.1 hypothetical protein Drose_06115 [Dactylosporangium roseum]
MTVTWLGCDLATGRIAAELPALAPSVPISRRIGGPTSVGFSLPLAGAPARWELATDPGRTMIVALADDMPVWAGIILTRTGGSAPTASLGCATPEAYFDRRYAGNHAWTQQDEASVIAAGLIGDTQVDGLGLTIDAPATGTPRNRQYTDDADATVLSRLQELMDIDGGPEFTVEPRWRAGVGPTTIELVARVRNRIGVQPAQPGAVFVHPGNVADYALAESYETGKGANLVRARGDGEGEDRHTSADMVASELLAAGWPRYEHRYTPGTSIRAQDVLDGHARAALEAMRAGAQVWTVNAVASTAPRLGRDWGLGDTVGLHVITSPRHRGGVMVTARAWGWEWDPAADRVSPILLQEA